MGEENKTNQTPEEKSAVELLKEIKANSEATVGEMKELKEKYEALEKENGDLKGAVDSLEKKAGTNRIAVEQKSVPGIRAARLWKCQIIASQEKKSVTEIAEKMYAERDETFVKDVKSLVAGGNAGILIQEDYFGEIIPKLYNRLSFIELGARKVPMPKGNLNIRKRVEGSSAQWIGESSHPISSTPKYANLRLNGKKLAVKVIISNDLLRSSEFSADELFLNDMIRELQDALDRTFYYGAGTEHTPRGIANIGGINLIDKPAELFDPETAYRDMVLPLKKANIPMESMGWAFSPNIYEIIYNAKDNVGGYLYRDELKAGTFHGYKYIETNQIAVGDTEDEISDIFFGDYAQAYIGDQLDIEMRVSDEATYYDENDQQVSAFDNDETVARGMMICDLGLVYGKSFSYGKYKTRG